MDMPYRRRGLTRLQPDERCPNTPAMDAGVTDHVWKIDGSVALLDRR
jgi:hypothetical protein